MFPLLLATRDVSRERCPHLTARNAILIAYNLSRIWLGALIGQCSNIFLLLLFTNDTQKVKKVKCKCYESNANSQ